MYEAMDLGARLVVANGRSVWRSFVPVYLVVVLAAFGLLELGLGWACLLVFCAKPWLDRTLLFVLARAAFREPTRLADVLLAARDVWWRDLWVTLTLRRLSPWRSYVQPVQQLEGQHGAPKRRRVRQILQNHHGAALAMQSAFSTIEFAFIVAALALPMWFMPIDDRNEWFGLFYSGDRLWISGVQLACYAATVGLLEPFFVGAGFAMYLNRRVELEAWDIEQEFRVVFAA